MVDLLLRDDRVSRLRLPQVTACIVDCVNFRGASRALQHCINLCEFGDAKFLTSFEEEAPYKTLIEKISSKREYSQFIMKRLADYISTEFVLIVQTDGFIVNIDKWDPAFLNYDYIGSPWVPDQLMQGANPTHLVGNGGFSLRSRRLHEFLRDDPNISITHPEDAAICQYYRPYLEDKGFTFAPVALAKKFGCENYIWSNSFGHHAYFHLHPAR